MKVIPASKFPKRDYTAAAWCELDFDDVMARLAAKPNHGTFRDTLVGAMRYRYKCLALSSRRYACIVEDEATPTRLEINLEIKKDRFFQEADLLEILDALGIETASVDRADGGFKWVPAKPMKPKTKLSK